MPNILTYGCFLWETTKQGRGTSIEAEPNHVIDERWAINWGGGGPVQDDDNENNDDEDGGCVACVTRPCFSTFGLKCQMSDPSKWSWGGALFSDRLLKSPMLC